MPNGQNVMREKSLVLRLAVKSVSVSTNENIRIFVRFVIPYDLAFRTFRQYALILMSILSEASLIYKAGGAGA